MIELIFAIVVIAIAIVSLPMMMQVNSKGMENNLAQEAIFGASVELMQASTGYWDANSMEDINVSDYSRVININGDCNSTTKLRPGQINQPYHRRCLDNNTTPPSDANSTIAGIKALEDFENTHQLYTDNTGGEAGYKETNLTISLSVTPDTNNTNIKILTAEVKDSNGNTVTKLYTQSANVGEPQYYKRMF